MNWFAVNHQIRDCDKCLSSCVEPTVIRGKRYCNPCIRKYKLLTCVCSRSYGEYPLDLSIQNWCGSCMSLNSFV